MRLILAAACAAATSAALATTAQAQPAAEPDSIVAAIQQGTLILEARPRMEHVDQTGVADADAATLRTRLGLETAAYRGVKVLVEFEDVSQLGGGDYNDGVPPAEPYATIADPDVTELNRAQIAWTINPHVAVTVGRQRIALDDQRFIGNSAWRQDEQTFDAVRADFTFGQFKTSYAYVGRVNRVFAEALDWEGDTHLLNASYAFGRPLKLTGFAYLLDFEEPTAALAQSSATYGLRATGQAAAGGVTFDYAASYAQQEDYGDNPAAFDLDYASAELTATWGIWSGRAMFEQLEGNGARGFSTPLASLHPFNGWADVFTTTPANGLTDWNVGVTVKPSFTAPYFSNLAVTARHHDFEAERTGADLGSEFDLQATASITRRMTLLAKLADYDGEGVPADTTRTWIGLEFRL